MKPPNKELQQMNHLGMVINRNTFRLKPILLARNLAALILMQLRITIFGPHRGPLPTRETSQ